MARAVGRLAVVVTLVAVMGASALSVTPRVRPCTIDGTPADDILRGTPGPDVICGHGGDDRIHGREGHDILLGGPGDDWVRAGSGRDLLVGGGGWDYLKGSRGVDRLAGGTGTDCLWAYDGRSERVAGGRGVDYGFVDEAADRVRGVEHVGRVCRVRSIE